MLLPVDLRAPGPHERLLGDLLDARDLQHLGGGEPLEAATAPQQRHLGLREALGELQEHVEDAVFVVDLPGFHRCIRYIHIIYIYIN